MANIVGVLHIGFYNFIVSDNVVALIDYRTTAAKKIVKSAREEKPRAVIDVTRGRKANTLIICTGDRYFISAIYRQQLAKRLGAVEVPAEEQITTTPNQTLKGPRKKINVQDVRTQEETEGTVSNN